MFQSKSKQTTGASALATTLALGALTLPSASAEGSALKTMERYGDSTALSADPMYKLSAAITRTDSVGWSAASAVAIAPDVYINSGHYTPRDGSAVAFHRELIFGANYNTSTARYQVDHTQRYPGFIYGDSSTIDLGVGWTKSFIAGFDKPITFGSIADGEIGTMIDYGNIGDPSTGEMPSLGDRMGGYAPKVPDSESPYRGIYPGSRYDFFDFNTGESDDIALNIQGLNFSSGAPWYNSKGDLCGLLIAKTNGISIGESIVLDLSNPEVQAYLQPIIKDSWDRYNASVPEPTSLTGAAIFGGGLLLRRRRESFLGR